MTEVLRRYRALIIAVSLLLFALLMWIFLSRQNTVKIPTRGVFVSCDAVKYPMERWVG